MVMVNGNIFLDICKSLSYLTFRVRNAKTWRALWCEICNNLEYVMQKLGEYCGVKFYKECQFIYLLSDYITSVRIASLCDEI
jgi:hypothetical protein